MLLITGGDVPRNEVNERNQGCQGEKTPEGGEIPGAGKLRIGRYDTPNIDFHFFNGKNWIKTRNPQNFGHF